MPARDAGPAAPGSRAVGFGDMTGEWMRDALRVRRVSRARVWHLPMRSERGGFLGKTNRRGSDHRRLFASFPIKSILVLDDVRRPPRRSVPLAVRRADRMPGFLRHRPPPDLELPRGATVEDVVRLTGTRATSPSRSRLESAPARHNLRSPRSATDPSRPRASRLTRPRRPARRASHTPPQRMAPPFPSARRSSPAPASVCSRRAISRRTRWCRGARTAATR